MLALVVAVISGALTTLAGMGGGTVLVLTLIATGADPLETLTATSVGLLSGNLHRAWLYRADLDRAAARALVFGGLPAAAIFARLAAELPVDTLRHSIVGVSLLGGALATSGVKLPAPQLGLGAAGAAVGAVSATTGAGGLLAGPLLLATGLTGRRYVGTGACLAASVHVGRLLGYGGGGGVSSHTLGLGLGFAVAVPVGNVLGDKLRRRLPASTARPLELGTAAVMAGLAAVGSQ